MAWGPSSCSMGEEGVLAGLVCEIFIIHTTCYSIILTTSFVFNIILNSTFTKLRICKYELYFFIFCFSFCGATAAVFFSS